MIGLTVEVSTAHLDRLFASLPVDITTAAKRAAARTRDWLATQLRRELAAEEKVSALAFKTRFRKGTRDAPATASLWIGVNPMRAFKAGPGIMTSKGARVGRRVFEHAFIAVMHTGHKGIFQREGEKREMTSGTYAGKMRQPIVEVRIPIDETVERILPKYEAPAARMFSERLEHEVNFLLLRKAA